MVHGSQPKKNAHDQEDQCKRITNLVHCVSGLVFSKTQTRGCLLVAKGRDERRKYDPNSDFDHKNGTV